MARPGRETDAEAVARRLGEDLTHERPGLDDVVLQAVRLVGGARAPHIPARSAPHVPTGGGVAGGVSRACPVVEVLVAHRPRL